jgi:hypothetical protein
MSPEAFWQWFSTEAPRLAAADPDAVAERVGAKLHAVDPQLGVEVGRAAVGAEAGGRELVLTAEGRSALFPRVWELVAKAPRLDGWRVVALRPARGFDFTLEEGGVTLDGAQLTFLPLERPEEPRHFGLRVYVPDALAEDEDIEEAVWRLLQVGVGEEAASHLEHLEVAPASADTRAHPLRLAVLGERLAHHRASLPRPGR